MEVTVWLIDSTLSSVTPSRRGVGSKLFVECWHSAHDVIEVTELITDTLYVEYWHSVSD